MSTSIEDDAHQLSQNVCTLLEIEAGLIVLQAHHRQLLAENTKLRSNIAAKQVCNAPMRSLIPELCYLVFAYAVESRCTVGCTAEIELSPVLACSPLTLAHVCRRWRSIVLDRPRLWADLHMKLSNPRPSLVPFWFKNARTVPMRVTVCPGTRSVPGPSPSKINPASVKDLIPYLHRIQSLSLHVHQTSLPLLFPRGSVSNMLQLEHLSIQHHGYILDQNEIGKINAPKLCALRLCDPSPFIGVLSLSLSTVKTLQVDKIEFWEYPRRVPELLSTCHELEDVTMTFPRNLYLAGSDPVSLPSVSRLSLEWRFPCNPIPIFSSVQAPQLRHLSLTHSNFLTTFSPEAVCTLQDLIQSAPRLTTLTLVGCNLTSICELSSIFDHAPALEELSLLNCHGTDRLLSDLTPADREIPSTWFCPRLERVRLAGVRDHDVRALVDFVRSRMRPPGPCANEAGHYLKELQLDTRIRDFSAQGRLLILRGLSIFTPSVKVVGPLDHIQTSPFSLQLLNK